MILLTLLVCFGAIVATIRNEWPAWSVGSRDAPPPREVCLEHGVPDCPDCPPAHPALEPIDHETARQISMAEDRYLLTHLGWRRDEL